MGAKIYRRLLYTRDVNPRIRKVQEQVELHQFTYSEPLQHKPSRLLTALALRVRIRCQLEPLKPRQTQLAKSARKLSTNPSQHTLRFFLTNASTNTAETRGRQNHSLANLSCVQTVPYQCSSITRHTIVCAQKVCTHREPMLNDPSQALQRAPHAPTATLVLWEAIHLLRVHKW
jgi:hypothetical protein